MTDASTIEKLRNFVLTRFPATRKKGLREDDLLLEKGIIDSMGVLELVEFIEEEFLIKVSDDDLVPENFETVARIGAYIQNRLNGVPVVQ